MLFAFGKQHRLFRKRYLRFNNLWKKRPDIVISVKLFASTTGLDCCHRCKGVEVQEVEFLTGPFTGITHNLAKYSSDATSKPISCSSRSPFCT